MEHVASERTKDSKSFLLQFVDYLGDRSFSEPSILLISKLNSLNYPKCHCRGKGREAIKAGERHMRMYYQ